MDKTKVDKMSGQHSQLKFVSSHANRMQTNKSASYTNLCKRYKSKVKTMRTQKKPE